ncbi:MAG: WD40 repeat domain-containing protein [Planctomycetales bacterium]|nr:WD40 repeat domain-containing protein [Planctomycetales bacterium]
MNERVRTVVDTARWNGSLLLLVTVQVLIFAGVKLQLCAMEPSNEIERDGVNPRHSSLVLSLDFSRNGKYLATASYDGQVIIWDTATGAYIRSFFPNGSGTDIVRFCPTGKEVLVAGSASGMTVWDMKAVKEPGIYYEPRIFDYWTYCAEYDNSGNRIIFGRTLGFRAKAFVIDSRTGEPLRPLTRLPWEHHGAVADVACGPDGKKFYSASHDGTIREWRMTDGQTTRQFEKIDGQLRRMALSPKGEIAAFCKEGEESRTIFIWDVESGKLKKKLVQPDAKIFDLIYSPNGRFIITGNRDGHVIIWDVEAGKQIRSFYANVGEVCCIAISPDARLLAIGGQDHTVRVWDLKAEKEIYMLGTAAPLPPDAPGRDDAKDGIKQQGRESN